MARNSTHLKAPTVHLLVLLGQMGEDLAAFKGSEFVNDFANIITDDRAELEPALCCGFTQRGRGDYESHLCKKITADTHQSLKRQLIFWNVIKVDLICATDPSVHSLVAKTLNKFKSAVSIVHIAFESSASPNDWPQIATAISSCTKLTELCLEFFGSEPGANQFPVLSALSQLKQVKLFVSDISANLLAWAEAQIVYTGRVDNILVECGIERIELNSNFPVSDDHADRLSLISARLVQRLHRLPPLDLSVDKAITLLAHLHCLTQLTINDQRMNLSMGSLVRMLAPLTNLEVLNLVELAHNLSSPTDQLPDCVSLPITKLIVTFSAIRSHERLHSSAWATFFSELSTIELRGQLSPCAICASGLAKENKESCHRLYFKDFLLLRKLNKTHPIDIAKLRLD